MKQIKYLLPALAAGCLLCIYAANKPEDLKIKPKYSAVPPAVQDASASAPVRLSGSEDGIPYGLYVVGIDNKDVTLRWNNPEPMDGYFDDFEGHSDFVVNSPGSIGWDYLDMDNQDTYTWSAAAFPNQGQKMAFIIMNPSKTSPSTADWPAIKPYSGEKILVAFTVDGGNNDYLISPELNFSEDFQVSFRAKSYTGQYGLERLRVGYSLTGKRASDFIYVGQEPYKEVPEEWTLMKYDIPKGAKYITINCVSQEAFMLLIDDLFVGTNKVRPRVAATQRIVGFNLYRDNQKVNSEIITEVYYTDRLPNYGDYTYTVTCVYSDGSESAMSEELSVNVPDIRLLPFEDDFSSWALDPDKWDTPIDEHGNANKWGIDYYVYGLVDPAATYKYSPLTNYSQSLVTREFRTLESDNTYLRFELRLLNYRSIDSDTLSVELSCDNEKWKEVGSFCNKEGTYSWKVKQYDLKDFLEGEFFRIRFRAHGVEASLLDYWYVDDIKVWNPEWASAKLTVQSQGGTFPNCPVTLTADHGAVINTVTDAGGCIDFQQIEKGNYVVRIEQEGYNSYTGKWSIMEDSNNQFTAVVTRPSLKMSETNIHADLKVEEQSGKGLTLKNEGDGSIDWGLSADYMVGSGDIMHRWEIQRAFDTSGDLQTSVAFDGENYYTASWYYMGKYFKYDKEGNFIEEFSVPGMYYKMYDLTFDGKYFYGSDNTNVLFQLDLRNKRLIKEIVIKEQPNLKITHCSYDSRNDQFWVGGFTTLGRVDRNGDVKVDFRTISDDVDVSAFGSAFDNITPGGPYLWLTNETAVGTNEIDHVQLVQYNLNTRTVTQVSHHAGDIPGYKIGSTTYGANYIGGIETTPNLVDGSLSLVGVLQQSPSRIFVYKLCETDTWLSYLPKRGTLESGAEQTVTINLNARKGTVGNTYTSKLKVYTIPELEIEDITIGYTVIAESETPRPINLRAEVEGNADVILSWEKSGSGKQPIGYNVYRNEKKITATPVTATQYTDYNLLHGDYVYTVTALYGNEESVLSDEVTVHMKIGAPYFPPTGLTSSVTNNKSVTLTWQSPDEMQKTPVTLHWDSGDNADAMGISEGGYFWAGALWEYEDLINYRGMKLDEAKVFINERCLSLTLQVYKDGQRVVSQVIKDIQYGDFNTIQLTNPVTIEPGYDYTVAFLIMHDAGVRPLGVDDTTPINGKGNLISMDGKEWYPATYMGFDSGNFNIAMHLSPSSTVETAPDSYNIYRDGKRINTQTVNHNSFTEEITQPGMYGYQVSAVYAAGAESALSDAIQTEIVNIGTPHAPSLLKAEVELNRVVKLRWNFPLGMDSSFPIDITNMNVTCLDGHPEFVSMFDGIVPNELGIASDGKYIYTSIHNSSGTINKYTLDGTFVESFVVNSDMNGIRNLTYDGHSFYAADTGNAIYRLDMDNKTVVDTISISEVSRHLTYISELDDGRGGFEVGDWESSIYVTMRGAKLGNGLAYKGAVGTAYYNGILYALEQGYEDSYTIRSYDWKTGKNIGSFSLKNYTEINPVIGSAGGGMSIVTTKEGLHLLAVVLQEPAHARFIFFDLEGIKGVEGYNIYRNGEKMNNVPLKYRYYTETETTVGEYSYEVETVYIDGTISAKSPKATIEIFDAGNCEVPSDVKAKPSTYGYDVIVSFVDPTSLGTDMYESAEDGTTGTAFARNGWENAEEAWMVTEDNVYQGQKALTVEAARRGWLIIPAGNYDSDFVFSFAARNEDDHKGNGQLKIYTSKDGNHVDDFTPVALVETTEAWKKYSYTFPAGTEYIAIRHDVGVGKQYVDALSIHDKLKENIYGYDILRDGKQLNVTPVAGISYTDHNLLPGTYKYQVRAHYISSCVSDYSDEITVEVDYSNNCQKPGPLSVEKTEEGVSLSWSAPALGDVINLKWHTGNAHDAAGMPSGGGYFAGVQWNTEELMPYAALSLSEVEVYINQIPDALYVLVYEGDDLMHQQYVPALKQYSFNTIVLDRPIRINTAKNLRVVIYVEHNEISIPLGYDEGPARTGKGDLYSADGKTWETLTANSIDGNWNITLGLRAYAQTEAAQRQNKIKPLKASIQKATAVKQPLRIKHLAETSTSARNTFDGYNVYCNSQRLNNNPLFVTSYLDSESHIGSYHEYQVTAVYSGCGEISSNSVRIYSTNIDWDETVDMRFYCEGSRIIIEGLQSDVEVSLFDTNGKMVYTAITDDTSVHVINTCALAEGIYLLRFGNLNAKVVVGK